MLCEKLLGLLPQKDHIPFGGSSCTLSRKGLSCPRGNDYLRGGYKLVRFDGLVCSSADLLAHFSSTESIGSDCRV